MFHRKSYHAFHYSDYKQRVMLFNQDPPFELHGTSKKPIWFCGRGRSDAGARPKWFSEIESWNHTESVYVIPRT